MTESPCLQSRQLHPAKRSSGKSHLVPGPSRQGCMASHRFTSPPETRAPESAAGGSYQPPLGSPSTLPHSPSFPPCFLPHPFFLPELCQVGFNSGSSLALQASNVCFFFFF